MQPSLLRVWYKFPCECSAASSNCPPVKFRVPFSSHNSDSAGWFGKFQHIVCKGWLHWTVDHVQSRTKSLPALSGWRMLGWGTPQRRRVASRSICRYATCSASTVLQVVGRDLALLVLVKPI